MLHTCSILLFGTPPPCGCYLQDDARGRDSLFQLREHSCLAGTLVLFSSLCPLLLLAPHTQPKRREARVWQIWQHQNRNPSFLSLFVLGRLVLFAHICLLISGRSEGFSQGRVLIKSTSSIRSRSKQARRPHADGQIESLQRAKRI